MLRLANRWAKSIAMSPRGCSGTSSCVSRSLCCSGCAGSCSERSKIRRTVDCWLSAAGALKFGRACCNSLPKEVSDRSAGATKGDRKVRLTVIGCGYVGLVTGACLAAAGHEVTCTDIDEQRIARLQAGGVPIYEHHLEAILASSRKAGRISYTTDAGEAIRAGDAVFICVGTPPKETGEADLSAIDHVARQIAEQARSPKLVI